MNILLKKPFIFTPWQLIITMAVLQLGDFATTSYSLAYCGGKEINPILSFINHSPNWIFWLALVKIGATMVYGLGVLWSLKVKSSLHWVWRALLIPYLLVVLWNLAVIMVSTIAA